MLEELKKLIKAGDREEALKLINLMDRDELSKNGEDGYCAIGYALTNGQNSIAAAISERLNSKDEFNDRQAVYKEIESLQEKFKQNPSNAELAKKIAGMHMASGNEKAAIEYFEKFIKITTKYDQDSNNEEYHIQYLQEMYNIYVLVHSTEVHLDCALTLNDIGLVYRKLGNSSEFYNFCKKSLDLITKLSIGDVYKINYIITSNVAVALEELNKTQDSLSYFEDALKIANILLSKGKISPEEQYFENTIDNINKVFSKIDQEDKELALTYAEHILDLRRANDYGLNTSALLPIALNRCAGIGVNMNDVGSIRKALLYMNQALQLSLNGLHCRDDMRELHGMQAVKAFYNMGYAHAKLKDTQKSIECYIQAYSLIKQYSANTNIQMCTGLEFILNQHAPNFLSSQQLRKIIFKVGQVTLPLLEIKSIIQVKALKQIQELAANGEWSKGKFFAKGVKSYLEDSFLTKLLGSEYNNQANLTIAKMLCFEAINIGIMSRHPDNNYICLVQYQKEFPDLFRQILSEHPEYFVDGSLLLLMEDDPNVLQELLDNKKLSCVDDVADMALLYLNKMTQQIKEIAKDTLDKIEELSSKEKWDAHLLRKGVVDLIQEKNLISILGDNLNQPDNIEMAKMLCFEAINKGAVSSKKYTCTKLFIQGNFDLIVKIAAVYPQYFVNKDVIETCFNSSDEKEKIYNEMKGYLNCHQDDSFCKEILGDLAV